MNRQSNNNIVAASAAARRNRRKLKYAANPNDGGNHSKTGYGPPDDVEIPIVQPEMENPPVGHLVVHPAVDFAYGNGGFYTKRGETFCDINGVSPPTVLNGVVRTSCTFKAGWVADMGKSDGVCTFAFVYYDHEPAKSPEGHILPRESGWYLIDAIQMLSDKLPRNGSVNAARGHTAAGLINKYFSTLSNTLRAQTYRYWLRCEFLHRRDVVGSTAAHRTIGDSPYSAFDAGTAAEIHKSHVAADHGEMVGVPGVDCHLPDNYPFKPIYSVRCHGAAECEPNFGRDAPPVYPTFGIVQDPNATKRLKYTRFGGFFGTAGDFMSYEVNGVNACKAMKRVLGGRPDELKLYANQLSLAAVLATKKFTRMRASTKLLTTRGSRRVITPAVLNKLLVSFKSSHEGSVARVGKGDLSHSVDLHSVKPEYVDTVLTGLDELQKRFNRTYIDSLLDGTTNAKNYAFYSCYQKMLEYAEPLLSRETMAEMPHVKRELRKQYVKGQVLHDDASVMVNRLKGCVKRELAKVGKVPRLFASYDAGSMYANEFPELCKLCLQAPMYFAKGDLADDFSVRIWILAKPRTGDLEKVFSNAFEGTDTRDSVEVIIYSDDMVLSGNLGGKPFGFNVDISSNDSSNNTLIFGVAMSLMSNFGVERALGLLEQCMKPLRVVNPDDLSSWIDLLYHSAFQGSGTVLTTFLNHIASFLNAMGIVYELQQAYSGLKESDDNAACDACIRECVTIGAARSGHVVTVEVWCDSTMRVHEKCQFLKRSPVALIDDRGNFVRWGSALNMGCVFRSFGSVEGDLTAKQLGLSQAEFVAMSWGDRADQFMSSVIRGHVHESAHPVWDALRTRFGVGVHVTKADNVFDIVSDEVKSSTSESTRFRADVESVCRRYDLSPHELDNLCAQIIEWKLGREVVCPALTAFYHMDYGM